MNKPEKLPMGVFQKLQKARIVLQSKALQKTGNNKFAGYKYFELADFLPTVNQIFYDLGLFSQVSYTHELATLRIVDTDDGSEVLFTSPMASAQLKGCHDIQNLGATETYERRYLYVTALEIVEHDAIDASEPKEPKRESAKSQAVATFEQQEPEEQEFLKNLADEVKVRFQHSVQDAHDYLQSQHLDADQKVAIWALFDSKMRTAIKTVSDAEKAKQLAEQA